MYNCGTRFVSTRVPADIPHRDHKKNEFDNTSHLNNDTINNINQRISDQICDDDTSHDSFNIFYDPPFPDFEEQDLEIPSLDLPRAFKGERGRARNNCRQIFVVRHAPHTHSKFCDEKRPVDNIPKPKKKYIK